MKTLVYIDHFKGQVQPAAWEALGAAKSFGSAAAVIFGAGLEELAKAAFEFGADEVLTADEPGLQDYRAEAFAATLSALASSYSPDLILFPTTSRTRELAAMSAIDLSTGVLADLTGLALDGDKLVATRPIYEGKLMERTICAGKPVMATLRARAFPRPQQDASRTGTATKVEAKTDSPAKVEGYALTEAAVSVTDAGVIVSGGRGVSNNPALTPPAGMDEKQAEIWRAQQGFKLVGELATVLGGAVGASREPWMADTFPILTRLGKPVKSFLPSFILRAASQAPFNTSSVSVPPSWWLPSTRTRMRRFSKWPDTAWWAIFSRFFLH